MQDLIVKLMITPPLEGFDTLRNTQSLTVHQWQSLVAGCMMCVSNMDSGAAAQAPVQALAPSGSLTLGRLLNLFPSP